MLSGQMLRFWQRCGAMTRDQREIACLSRSISLLISDLRWTFRLCAAEDLDGCDHRTCLSSH